MAGTGLASRDPHAEEEDSFLGQGLFPPGRILEMGVSAIDDEVPGFEVDRELTDHLIHGIAGRDENQDRPRLPEACRELLQGISRFNRLTTSFFFHEPAGFFLRSVVDAYAETFVGHVESKVAAHDPQAHQTDVARFVAHVSVPPHSIKPRGFLGLSRRAYQESRLYSRETVTKSRLPALFRPVLVDG